MLARALPHRGALPAHHGRVGLAHGRLARGIEQRARQVGHRRARAQALGPLLGSYHPCVVDNIARLREISGLDEVSFHMSGTEAVMQAVRLASYHTKRTHLVRFCGAYHGWWSDVQPGPGNPDEFARFQVAEIAKWAKVIRDSGTKAE